MSSQPAIYKIFVAGNHDDMCEAVPSLVKQLFHENDIIYLDNAQVEIEGIKIWGSPYTPRYGGWSFMKERGDEMSRIWKMIPEDTDILITHGPPMNILDFTLRGKVNAGCWDLAHKIKQIKPKLHLFGHVHEGYGTHFDGTTRYYNSSILDVDYQFTNELQMINYED
jgi:Icc-related predicted phosphoesterase